MSTKNFVFGKNTLFKTKSINQLISKPPHSLHGIRIQITATRSRSRAISLGRMRRDKLAQLVPMSHRARLAYAPHLLYFHFTSRYLVYIGMCKQKAVLPLKVFWFPRYSINNGRHFWQWHIAAYNEQWSKAKFTFQLHYTIALSNREWNQKYSQNPFRNTNLFELDFKYLSE